MSLTQRLPTELLNLIVEWTLPEGFESLAATNKRFYGLCKPLIDRHNALKREYSSFVYRNWNSPFPFTSMNASHLIARIMDEPIVARYIRRADFTIDGWASMMPRRFYDVELEEQYLHHLASFLQRSSTLRQARLDPLLYAARIADNVENRRYSQHASAFLLTMLPNLETLRLPTRWGPNKEPDSLINSVVQRALIPHSANEDLASLRKLSAVFTSTAQTRPTLNLKQLDPFLALPRVQNLSSQGLLNDEIPSVYCSPPQGFRSAKLGSQLKIVVLEGCRLSTDDISILLQNSTLLELLRYSHAPLCDLRPWYLSGFLSAIARRVGGHLTELSLSNPSAVKTVVTGRTVVRGDFLRLRKLELPATFMEFIGPTAQIHNEQGRSLLEHLVPTSVSDLSFVGTPTWSDDGSGLEALFSEAPSTWRTTLPCLKQIHLPCPHDAHERYRMQCARLEATSEGTGIMVSLQNYPHSLSLHGDEET